MKLASQTRPDLIFIDLPGPDRQTVLRAIAERFAAAGVVDPADPLYLKLLEREDLGSTCIAPGVAVPHCKLAGVDEVFVSIGICPGGVDFGGPKDEPVRLFFTVISPEDDPAAHLHSLALISRWIKANNNVEKLLELTRADQILAFLGDSNEVA